MKKTTAIAFSNYLKDQAKLNDVGYEGSGNLAFNVTPSIEQKFIETLSESTKFLQTINLQMVENQVGESLGLDISGPIASRTNTNTGERTPTNPHKVNSRDTYTAKQTNFDSFVRYETLDAWAKHKDFQTRLSASVLNRMAQDKIMIGFNGTSAAATTNIATNKLLQDVNIGWLAKIRGKPERYKNGVNIYAGGDFNNVDACVYDFVASMMDPWFKEDPELVVYASRDIVDSKYFGIYNSASDNVNAAAGANLLAAPKTLGGLPVVDAPYLPSGTILVTAPKNLSIYTQENSMRKNIVDAPNKDRIETYMSMNDAYLIENFGRAVLIDNIKLKPAA